MTEPFQPAFAKYYDLLYADKDYAAECRLLEAIFAKYGAHPKTLLDAGCGSGGHATELARRGYRVTGVDRSEGLLAIARQKAAADRLDIRYTNGDLRSCRIDGPVDACLCLFGVLSFQLTNEDLQAVLRGMRASLASGGLLVCDVWNGTAVLTERPQPRLKTITRDGVTMQRLATPRWDTVRQTVETTHHVFVTNGQGVLDTVVEAQTVRYFFPQELLFHLDAAGFDVLELFAFPSLGSALTEKDWNTGVVARARPHADVTASR